MSTDISKVVNVQIDVKSSAPTRASFGTPLIACVCPFQDTTREYSDPSEMLDDGFTSDQPAYAKALTMWGQEPHPPTFKVGKRQNVWTFKYLLGPQEVTEGYTYRFEISGTEIEYVVPAAASKAIVATGLQLLITAISGITATVSTDFVAVTDDAAGSVHAVDLKKLDPLDVISYKDTTADPGIVADLTQIYKVDPNWYGLLLDVGGSATVEAAAAWVEGKPLISAADSTDTGVIDVAVTDDLFSVLQDNSYDRTTVIWRSVVPWLASGNADAAWLSLMLTYDPGTATWAHQTLKGVPVDDLQAGWQNQIEAKGGNHYTEIAGIGTTFSGQAASGEYTDITRFVDYLENTIAVAVFAIKAALPRVPFTNKGIGLLVAAVQGVLKQNTSSPAETKGLSPQPPPLASAPDALDLPVADRLARILDKISFTANLSGAIHTTKVQGSISI